MRGDTPRHLLVSQVISLKSSCLPAMGIEPKAEEGKRLTLLVHLSAELTSTAGSQGQSEGRGSSLSIHSLPSGPSSPFSTDDQPVASWALSFERLLQDPLGLAYFTVSLGKGWGRMGGVGQVPLQGWGIL